MDESYPPCSDVEKTAILEIKGLTRKGVFHDINLVINCGEILGITGMIGSGRTELARAIFGADPIDEGIIIFNGAKIEQITPRKAIDMGIAFITEDRKEEGLILGLSIRKNLSLTILNKLKKLLFINNSKEKEIVQNAVLTFNIRTPSIEREVKFLSGGNQQKTIVAKWMGVSPKLIIMDEPTRGIDIGAKTEIYDLMRRMAQEGAAIIMISSELPEVLGMSDRIIVMRRGEISKELIQAEASEEKILTAATG
jgi:ribose transport system ATP-binding protein